MNQILSTLAFLVSSVALADGPVPAGAAVATSAAASQPSTLGMIFPFVLMFGVVYFLMIRPQQKKMKEQQALLAALKTGDEVVTSSGLLGKISGIAEKVVTLDLGNNVKVKMLKSQVAQVVKGQINELNS